MIYGHVRDRFARVALTLPGHDAAANIEFIVDTGFDGDLALPLNVISRLEVTGTQSQLVRMADGSESERSYFKLILTWADEERVIEVLALEGSPLLGVGLLEGNLLQAEMQDGGEVSLEPL